MKMRKYHGLGNDYLVIDACSLPHRLPDYSVRLLCSQHYGAGSDGILTGPFMPGTPDFLDIQARASIADQDAAKCLCALRILNPDASEAEKSGNGLRIFSRYLYDMGLARLNEPFSMLTLGGMATATVLEPDDAIRVDMGRAHFTSRDFPGQGESLECSHIVAGDRAFVFCAASVGNPHCVVLDSDVTEENTRKYGPFIENAPMFPNRINVQFLKVLDKHGIFISIWERGAGYTLASGSSASAAAAVAVRMGFCQSPVKVHSPGGILSVDIDGEWNIVQTGPVQPVYELEWLGGKLL